MGTNPTLPDDDPVGWDAPTEADGVVEVGFEGVEIAVVDADEFRAGGDHPVDVFRLVQFDQRCHAEFDRQIVQLLQEIPFEALRNEQHRVRPGGAGFVDLVRIDQEVLSQNGNRDAARTAVRKSRWPWKNSWSVKTLMQLARAPRTSWRFRPGRNPPRMTPLEGLAFFTSAIKRTGGLSANRAEEIRGGSPRRPSRQPLPAAGCAWRRQFHRVWRGRSVRECRTWGIRCRLGGVETGKAADHCLFIVFYELRGFLPGNAAMDA